VKGSKTAIECEFPIVEISALGEQESWRKEVNRPIYHIHKWWATRLGSVFRAITLGALSSSKTKIWEEFYNLHNLSDKVVLDPFMGSGTTLGETLKLGAKAVGCDINPVSTFLVRQAFTKVPEEDLKKEFSTLEATVSQQIRQYYQTIDPQTGDLIPVLYFFWCKFVTTPEGEHVPLLSRFVFSQDAYPKKKPKAQILCPKCWNIIEGRFDSTSANCTKCHHEFNPQEGPADRQHVKTVGGARYKIKDLLPKDGSLLDSRLYAIMAIRPDGSKVYLPVRESDRALYQNASERLKHEELPLPTLEVRAGHNTDQARGYNYFRWRDFFNDRQLLCLGLLLRAILKIKNTEVQEQMLCLFSSTLEFNNQFCSFKGEGTGAVRHMFSNHILKPERTPLENSVWGHSKSSGTFSTLFESRLLRAKRYLDEPFELVVDQDLTGKRVGNRKIVASLPINATMAKNWEELKAVASGVLILNGDSSNLTIPDASIDAVVTDPPYFDFVHYSELSDFFYAWLSPVLAERHDWMKRTDSSEKGEVQHKDPRTFANLLSNVLNECYRVLKPDGILAFSFHHSRAEGWAAIHEALSRSGFVVTAAHPVHAEFRGSSPKNAAKNPISIDAILVCRKKAYQAEAPSSSAEIQSKKYIIRLTSGGYQLSSSDQFVIFASQMLVEFSGGTRSFEFVRDEIESRSRNLPQLQKLRVPLGAQILAA